MKGFFITIFTVCSLILQAQHPYYYTLNDEHGLPSNEVYQVIQDDFGYMWIGCDAGLFRYDGFNFKPYTCNQQNSKSISNLKKDKDGQIWCQNFTGQIFKAEDDSLVLIYDASPESRQFPPYTIDSDNKIWIATDERILVLNNQGKEIKSIKNPIKNQMVQLFFDVEQFDEESMQFVSSVSHTYRVNRKTYEITEFNYPEWDKESRNNLLRLGDDLYSLREEMPDRKYVIHKLYKTGNIIATYPLETDSGEFLYYLTAINNEYFLCGSDGIEILDKNFKRKKNIPSYFPGQKISHLYQDKEGNLWATSLQDGIFIIPAIDIKVWNKNNSVLTDNNISHIYFNSKGELLAGTYAGVVFTIDTETGNVSPYIKNIPTDTRAIRSMLELNQSLYVAQGPFRVYKNNQVETITMMNNTRDFAIRNGIAYYITTARIGYYDLKTNKNNILLEKGGRKLVAQKNSDIVFYATDNAFLMNDGKDLREISYHEKPVYTSDLAVLNDKIYVATQNSEILVLENLQFNKLEVPGLKQSAQIKSIYVNDSLLIYAGSEGLVIYNFKNRKTRNLNVYDGLAFKEINEITVHNGTIYLATLKGVVSLPLNERHINKVKPKIKIQSINSEKILFKDANKIELSYGEINLKINFISTSFRSRGHFHYEYRIRNFSDQWVKVSSTSPSVIIPYLPAGEFIFEVVSVNEDGVRSNTPARILIEVKAPYWQKWWFYLILVIGVAIIISIIFYLRIRYLKQTAEAKNRVLLSQLTALKAQMNPHFMYNTLNSIQDLIIQNDIKSTNYYLSKFSTLMRMILKASDSNKITVEEEIEILQLYLDLEKLRFGDEFNYEVKADFKKGMQSLLPSMILQPYVENAIKHGLLHKKGEKFLRVLFKEEQEHFTVEITDNGVGRQKSAEIKARQSGKHASFATQATEKRIELLSQYDRKNYSVEIIDLYHENGETAGTKVIVKIPF